MPFGLPFPLAPSGLSSTDVSNLNTASDNYLDASPSTVSAQIAALAAQTHIYVPIESTTGALPAAADNSDRLGLVGTNASDAVLHYSNGTTWISTGVVDLGDMTDPDPGSFDGQLGYNNYGQAFRWSSSLSHWLPPRVYAGTSPTLRAELVGTENAAARLAAGYTDDTADEGTITTDGTKITLSALDSNTTRDDAFLILTTTAWLTTSVEVFWDGIVSSSVVGDDYEARLLLFDDGTDRLRLIRRFNVDSGNGFRLCNHAGNEIGERVTNTTLASEAYVQILVADGFVQWWVNGALYAVGTRAQANTSTTELKFGATNLSAPETTEGATLTIRRHRLVSFT